MDGVLRRDTVNLGEFVDVAVNAGGGTIHKIILFRVMNQLTSGLIKIALLRVVIFRYTRVLYSEKSIS